MSIRIALAGNPNCGKTTLFNELTGANQYVGNWPGVTVEKKEGSYKKDKACIITDLPGIYSLSPYSPEEIVSRNYLIDEVPDVVINVIDATNLERNLYLTTQLLALGLPVVVALNMFDLVEKNGDYINKELLSAQLGAPVVEISALRNTNLEHLMHTACHLAREKQASILSLPFFDSLENAIEEIADLLPGNTPDHLRRWYAVKLFEDDESVISHLQLSQDATVRIDEIRARLESQEEDDGESIVAAARYELIAGIIAQCYARSSSGLSTTQKIDKIVTNRWLGLPIFIIVMFFVYWVSVSTVGQTVTDWTNDGLFGDGWLYSGTEQFEEASEAYEADQEKIAAYLAQAEKDGLDVEEFSAAREAEEPNEEDEARIEDFLHQAQERNLVAPLKTDEGIETLSFEDFEAALQAEEPKPEDYGTYVEGLSPRLESFFDNLGVEEWVKSLAVSGILAGVGAVIGFVPQMLILFIMLSFLESCGYLARVAFIMDRLFRRFGLSGKSFIPMLIASGCGVPAIMSTKTIENEHDRRMTIMTATMIPCGAKLPIIALVFGALAGANSAKTWWVAPFFYFLGIFAIVISGIMLKKTRLFAGDVAPFVMELPSYHLPALKTMAISVWDRIKGYLIKAGTVIFLSSMLIWFLLNYGIVDGSFASVDPENTEEIAQSFMALLGGSLAWIFEPLGFGSWQSVVTSITGLIAKENVVSTVGIMTALDGASESNPGLWEGFAFMFGGSHAAVVSFCAFNLLCAPCIAAMAAIYRQMNDARWTLLAIGYMTIFAWCVAFILYQFVALALGEVHVGPLTIIAIVLLAVMLFQIVRPAPSARNKKA